MSIDIQALETFSQVAIGCDRTEPLLVNDSLFATFIVAEGVDANDNPVNPAPFGTDNGGWVAELEVVDGNLPLAVVNPLTDDGEITVTMAPDVSTAQVCVANIRVTNAALPAKRTIFRLTVTVTDRDPNP